MSNLCHCVLPDDSVDGAKKVEDEQPSSPDAIPPPAMDRNPSPPPDSASGEEDEAQDAIGDTVYSKHWLFSTLTRLIHVSRLMLQPN